MFEKHTTPNGDHLQILLLRNPSDLPSLLAKDDNLYRETQWIATLASQDAEFRALRTLQVKLA